jgi:HPt (histidine-containing phosphotransfer) domain-containing protein
MQRIKEGLAQGNAEWVRQSAHAIKGMVGVFSAEKTTEAAALVERIAGQDECGAAVEELEVSLNELQEAIKQYSAL